MAEISVMPSNDLTLSTQSKVQPNRFILFTDSWLNLQNYIETCLQLPINQGDFEQKYGSFAQKELVTNALTAMKDVRDLSSDFGNPSTLKKRLGENPDYIFTKDPPNEIYAHIVWLASQIQNAASTFTFTFASLKDLIGPSAGTPAERAQNLKDVLIGQGGLVSTADDMKKKTSELLRKLMAFDGKFSAANEHVQRYAGQSSDILAAANKLVGDLTNDIENRLKPASEAAWKAWRDYTIAASVTSVGLFLIGAVMFALAPVTFGATAIAGGVLMAGGVACAAALGSAAKSQRDVYNDLQAEIAQKEEEKKKKVRLVSDLTGFNGQIGLVAPAMKDFKKNLETIESIWLDIGGKLAYICTTYTVEQLSDLPWVTQAFKITDATNKWKNIQVTTQEFTQTSLVSYDFGRWGDRIPEPAAA
ncbi:MAG TPA: alpha-xenorhabdolysin family binary toxin subunit A [Terriglobia bacterium]|nr:alpha-xenorhabdolysin family binary toxin subunit A [Terriglobia bacterium]